MAYADRDIEPCLRALEKVLARQPMHVEALVLRTRAKLAAGRVDEAIEDAETLVTRVPRAGGPRYELALAHLRKGEIEHALANLEKAAAISPDLVQASLLQAEILIRQRKSAEAVPVLEALIERRPNLVRAYLLLGSAYRGAAMQGKALEVYRRLDALAPGNEQLQYLIGLTYEEQGQLENAVPQYEAALQKKPDFLPPLVRLVVIDHKQGASDKAVKRIEDQIAANPDAATLRYLLGRTLLLLGRTAEAEAAMHKTIELKPDFLEAYSTLGRIYAAQGQDEAALEKLNALLKLSPDDITSLVLAAAIHEKRGELEEAIAAYKAVLEKRPGLPVAANNLAYLYAEHTGDLERAFELASQAREDAPQDPYVADTFAWILHRRGNSEWALSLLQESAQQLPDEPEVLYHLGVAYHYNGMDGRAVETLASALEKPGDFRGRAAASNLLAVLRIPLDRDPSASERQTLDAALAADPANPAALLRQGKSLERAGDAEGAQPVFRDALRAAPNYVPAMLALADILVVQSGESRKAALELLEQAKSREPGNIEVKQRLAWAAYLTGRHKWALGLMRECAEAGAADAVFLYRYGQVLFANGRTTEARARVEQCLAGDTEAALAAAARRFMMLTGPDAAGPDSETVAMARAELGVDAGFLPALALLAENDRRHGTPAEAIQSYGQLLRLYPEFAPGYVALAALLADRGGEGDLTEARNMANKARDLLPQDAGVAAVLGRVACLGGDFDYAMRVLEEGLRTRPDDAQMHYFLGVCRQEKGMAEEGRASLQKALELDPAFRYAEDARARLAGD
jgi:tetratricopeptide (TPR) repeat protein